MSQRKYASTEDDDAIDLAVVWPMIWRYKILIALACLVFGAAAVAVALTSTAVYRAEVIVTEVHDRGLGGAGSLATQLGGLASLAGVNLSAGGSGSQEAQAVLVSHRLVEEFIKRNGLLPVLLQGAKQPTLWFAVRRFQDSVVAVRSDQRKGTTIVAVEWTDPTTAARWANAFVALANELVRTRALSESTRNIAYINEQLAKTNEIELRKVMYSIIESETKTLMLANGRAEYAFEVVDPAVPPEIRARPQRTLIVLVGLLLGLFVGIVTTFILDRIRRPGAPGGRAA